VRRQEFITLLGWAAAWPLAASAQEPQRVRRIGALMPFPESDPVTRASVKAFVDGLAQLGWMEGKNIRIDYRFAAGNQTLFKTYAAELVRLSPDAILTGNTPAVAALRQQTHAIPIVFVLVADPVGLGFVQSLPRPGENITRFSAFDPPIMGKWLQLLKAAASTVIRVAVIFNPDTAPYASLANAAIEAAASSLGLTVKPAPVHNIAGIEEAIAAAAREPGGGLIALPDSFNTTHHNDIIAAAARHRLPLIGTPEYPRAGGLMSYWFDVAEQYGQAASYIDRILKGASPSDLPVQYPTKYSLIINLKTAKTLSLTIPSTVLELADEVIE
jgi:putative ABC transport system substrate-binding protein